MTPILMILAGVLVLAAMALGGFMPSSRLRLAILGVFLCGALTVLVLGLAADRKADANGARPTPTNEPGRIPSMDELCETLSVCDPADACRMFGWNCDLITPSATV